MNVSAQDRPTRIWDGIYTVEQAQRGDQYYAQHCAECHGSDLTGGDEAPSLVGVSFVRAYGSRYLDRLFRKIQTRMPANDVMAIGDKEKLDITAYLLSVNGFPPGQAELPLDVQYFSTIRIVGKDGPEPAPIGAMVEVMGCLMEDGKGWMVTNATPPVVADMDDPEADAVAAAKHPLGTLTVALLDVFPRPDQHKGHKMIVKGLLIRNNDKISLNVLRLGEVAKTCP